MIRFSFLTGDMNWQKYGGKWISNKQNNGEFDYWLVIEVRNTEGNSEITSKYDVELQIVAPSQSADQLSDAAGAYNMTVEELKTSAAQVQVLSDYGTYVVAWQDSGNNIKKLMKEARQQAQNTDSMFGFIMDRPVNRIGTTGWEAIKGDLLAGLKRGPDTPEKNLMRKLHGVT